MKEPRKDHIVGAGFRCRAERATHLSENLGLSDDHRFDAGGDSEEVPGSVTVGHVIKGVRLRFRAALKLV